MTTIFITGTNRGIGRELLKHYLQVPHATIISAVRNPRHATVDSLADLPLAQGTRHIVVKLDITSPTDFTAAVEELKTKYKLISIDTVIGNAGGGSQWGLASKAPIEVVEENLKVNTVGNVRLLQALFPFLEASAHPKFVVLSTILASITMTAELQIPDAAYGLSKAALNFYIAKLHHENPKLVTFPIHPGWVNTEFGNNLAKEVGMKEAPTTIEESGKKTFDQIQKATREETGGKFIDLDGKPVGW